MFIPLWPSYAEPTVSGKPKVKRHLSGLNNPLWAKGGNRKQMMETGIS